MTGTSIRVHRPRPLSHAPFSTLCFPYAGGDALLFYAWLHTLVLDATDRTEICPLLLPGCYQCFGDPLFTKASSLVDALIPPDLATSPLYPYLDWPFVIFEANPADETAQALLIRCQRGVTSLYVASCRVPQFRGPLGVDEQEYLKGADLAEQLYALDETPEPLLSCERHPKLVPPKIKADARMLSCYVYTLNLPLGCPATVCAGLNDESSNVAEFAAWQKQTLNTFRMYPFDGDYFFVRDAASSTRTYLPDYFVRTVQNVLPLERTAKDIVGKHEQVTVNGYIETHRGKRGNRCE